jgi:hypothetical protein
MFTIGSDLMFGLQERMHQDDICLERKRSDRKCVAFWLDVLPGLLGIFELGHLYVGARARAFYFLVWTAILIALVAWAILVPSTFPPLLGAPGMPVIWFVGWVGEAHDIRSLTR